MTRRGQSGDQPDLFSVDPSSYVPSQLSALTWPDASRFPVNHLTASVRRALWDDLVGSPEPVLVAGFSAIGELVDVIAAWDHEQASGRLRVLIGGEPFGTDRTSFASTRIAFTDEVRTYWLDHGVSLRQSAKLVRAVELIRSGRVAARIVEGRQRLHAKIYVGADAASVGSSNFTRSGLGDQLEANARFERASNPDRYGELVMIAENYWEVGTSWDDELVALLDALLRFVPWQEALARACADLLEGEWADRYVTDAHGDRVLWPSQRAGIAQALWIAENVGSVLIADATGSGKTRMGAHLVRAVRDRLWSTGRVRRDLTVLVCPPSVRDTWFAEAVSCGLSMVPVSHGLLSRAPSSGGTRNEVDAVRNAQILAIDEAHNFLGHGTNRTKEVRDSLADHVLLFTATPINQGPSDLLQLVALLGADNFDDSTLAVLDRLDRRRGPTTALLGADERAQLRREIQRFTVRRTKQTLNSLVGQEPDAYRDPDTGRVAQYPSHEARVYATGETAQDSQVADTIRWILEQIDGINQLEQRIEVPASLRAEYNDERWLTLRLRSCTGLAAHHVLSAMRSSRAALIEHLIGTDAARNRFDLRTFKRVSTGNVLAQLRRRADGEPPTVNLSCEIPDWLTDPTRWRERCLAEVHRYERILEQAEQLSAARETAKADLLRRLTAEHPRVLAFDRHLITLALLQPLVGTDQIPAVVATGSDQAGRRNVSELFARDSTATAVALCSDAMNEGLNLQGASAIVHLDLPTTLRVAEQRVGRVDRMNSPYDAIEAWWPNDGPSFATRSNELLIQRAEESSALLGSNLPVPQFGTSGEAIDLTKHIHDIEHADARTWDGIHDALEPVRSLVTGEHAVIPAATYNEYRSATDRVVARVSPVASAAPWAFFAIAGTAHGAPRWLLLEGKPATPVSEIDVIVERLRTLLNNDPPARPFDDTAHHTLLRFLDTAGSTAIHLLPRRLQRALDQLTEVTRHWQRNSSDPVIANRWDQIHQLAVTAREHATVPGPDMYALAQRWLELVTPIIDEHRQANRNRRYTLLRHITPQLKANPLDIDDVERALTGIPHTPPIDQRITACILGVTEDVAPKAFTQLPSGRALRPSHSPRGGMRRNDHR